MHQSLRIGVVGSGIAGISAAWLLANRHRVRLFERNRYYGGHTHTVEVIEDGRRVPVDTGFIVYNEPNYPHLTGLFQTLDIGTRDTEMSFSVSVGRGRLEYAGSDLNTLFAQRRNLLDRGYVGMVWDILRFNRLCKQRLRREGFGDMRLEDLLLQVRLGDRFRDDYLLPMAAAIWSCPPSAMLDFPAASFARFFANHGLLNLRDRPQWKTVSGGSARYVERMLADLGADTRCGDPVTRVTRSGNEVSVRLASGEQHSFDHVVMACHADESLSLITDALPAERQILSSFRYQPNRAILHTDEQSMPRNRRVWSSWNYLADESREKVRAVSVTYWMNRLQALATETDYFVSLNPLREPRPGSVVAEMTYEHPVFDRDAIEAQGRLSSIQGSDRIWYTGSYFGYGFHEDALRSSVLLAQGFGVRVPWLSHDQQGHVAGAAG